MAFVGRRMLRLFLPCLPALLLAPVLSAQAPLETIPDPARLPAAEVPFVNPLWQPLDAPAAPKGPPPPLKDLEVTSPLVVGVKLDESGTVSDAVVPEPPLRALAAAVLAQAPRWTFKPATKDGVPVRCWGTYGVDVEVELEDATWHSFALVPVGKDDPLPELSKERPGESWMSRYPAAVTPAEPGVFSAEEVDFLPMPAKVPLKLERVRLKSRLFALVEVSGLGSVKRVVPVGAFEPMVLRWVRESAKEWTLAAARKGGSPVSSWLALDTTIEYSLGSVKERGKRSIKKNVRGEPAP
ncbi:MAG: hypothetical protein ACYDBY_10600 [Thermoanaerobaculia bacterium]